jgi:predicted PurR-regulated permease PerM
MSDLIVGLITIFGTIALVTGVVLYVFNGTKQLIKEMHKTQQDISKTQQDILKTQQDMLEILKKGFGDLSRDISEIKEAVIK